MTRYRIIKNGLGTYQVQELMIPVFKRFDFAWDTHAEFHDSLFKAHNAMVDRIKKNERIVVWP